MTQQADPLNAYGVNVTNELGSLAKPDALRSYVGAVQVTEVANNEINPSSAQEHFKMGAMDEHQYSDSLHFSESRNTDSFNPLLTASPANAALRGYVGGVQ